MSPAIVRRQYQTHSEERLENEREREAVQKRAITDTNREQENANELPAWLG